MRSIGYTFLLVILLEVVIAQQDDEYVKIATSLCNAGYKQYCLSPSPEQKESLFTAPLINEEPQPEGESPSPSPSPIVLFIPQSARPSSDIESPLHKCHDRWINPRSLCKQPKDPGFCRGYFPRYYYSTKNKTCERMVYGGCLGNQNNFKSFQDCMTCCKP